MSDDLRIKKLRGSGGFVMAQVTDEQQRKGNLGGPDLFLAPIGRLDVESIKKYTCNTCDKEFNVLSNEPGAKDWYVDKNLPNCKHHSKPSDKPNKRLRGR